MYRNKIHIIIVAAGSGSRFGADVPKQFCLLKGRPVVMHTIDAFRRGCPGAEITLVLNRDFIEYWQNLCERYDFISPNIVCGGDTRWQSVKNAISTIKKPQFVAIHDGARPLIAPETIARLISEMDKAPEGIMGIVPVVPVTDSLRQTTGNGSIAIDRAPLRAVQTPQIFLAEPLIEAYEAPYSTSFTDDASVVENTYPRAISMAEGHPFNIKITNPLDIAIAEAIINNMPL